MTDFGEGLNLAAELMCISARTAPKGKGEDFIEVKVLSTKNMEKLGKKMVAHGKKKDLPMWVRDGKCVLSSGRIVLIGVRDPVKEKGVAEGPCVQDDVFAQNERVKRYIDLGIAIGSAAKTASMLNIDNRVMYRVGEMARRMGILKAMVVIGIPLSANGKNIYFDR